MYIGSESAGSIPPNRMFYEVLVIPCGGTDVFKYWNRFNSCRFDKNIFKILKKKKNYDPIQKFDPILNRYTRRTVI